MDNLMNTFNFIEPDEILSVTIRGKKYPVKKSGQGIPCLFICLGTPSFRTISKNFSKHFTIYSSDVYWINENCLENPESVTIDTIIDDIKLLADALNLKKYILFGHSAYGIIALEFAKKYPDAAAGILMIGTPINSNANVAEINNKIFENTADQNRKEIDKERREHFKKEDLIGLSQEESWIKAYIYRDAPRYWHIPTFDCSKLWEGIHVDKLLTHLFEKVLPKINVLEGLNKIKIPVFLAAGISDFDCCPWMWKDIPHLPQNFIISIFDKSGHWPHYEQVDLFDQRVIEWTSTIC